MEPPDDVPKPIRHPDSCLDKERRSGWRTFALWEQAWIPAALALVALVIGLVTLDVVLLVVALVVGFCAFLGWAIWAHIDK